ncbi:MAG: YfhO family protein [Lachnospiraceae bacterium]|nr:YfhO family protein [Lachnospiraceae bacterium]
MRKRKIALSCILSFVITGLFAALFYYVEGVYPGAKKTILLYDELSQYYGIWGYARYLFDSPTNFLYNWSIFLGGNNICQMAYYVGNPINLIVALFPINDLPVVVYFLTISKFAFAALSMSIFLVLTRRNEMTVKSTVLFSMCFGLMSYMVMYSMSLMWLDAVILFPITMALLERLIIKRKAVLFSIFLSMIFYANFYIGYMVVLFSFLYFIYCEIRNKKSAKEALLDFINYAISGIVAAMLAAPVLVTTVKGLTLGKGSESPSFEIEVTNNLLKILKKLFSCQYDSITNYGTPSLFVGTFVLILALIYLIDRNRRLLERLYSLFVLFFLIISMWIKPLDMIWHGFNVPICFPGRYSFVFSFMVIILAVDGAKSVRNFFDANSNSDVLRSVKKYVIPVFYIVTAFELWLNGSQIIGSLRLECPSISEDKYRNIVDTTWDVLSFIPKEDVDFYRIDGQQTIGRNDAMLFGYKGFSSFSSTYNNDVLEFVKYMGLLQHDYVFESDEMTPFIRSVLGGKYLYSSAKVDYPLQSSLYESRDYLLYKNEMALPLGFAVKCDATSDELFNGNLFENNNSLSRAMSGIDDIYVENKLEKTESVDEKGNRTYEVYITVSQDGPLYIYFEGESKEEHKARMKAIKELIKTPQERYMIPSDKVKIVTGDVYITEENLGWNPFYLFEAHKGDVIRLDIESNFNIGEGISYTLDLNKYKKAMEVLSSNAIAPYLSEGSIYSGKVSLNEASLFFFSIPYIPGISVKLDGEVVEARKIYTAFTGVDIPKGEHEIEVLYFPDGLKLGIILGLLGLLSIVILSIYGIKLSNKNNFRK